jgi:Fe2+ transport system protein FeoA
LKESNKGLRLVRGQTYRISRIKCDKRNRRRLAEIGILEGTKVKLCGSNNQTYRVKVRESFFAISRGIFTNIELEENLLA